MAPSTRALSSRTACLSLAAAISVAGFCSPAIAWDSAYHTSMIQLTQNVFQIPGVKGSYQIFVRPKMGQQEGNAEGLCYTDGDKKSVRDKKSAKDRVWLDLICGTDEPDHERKTFLNAIKIDFIFHNSEAEQRAVYEFNKAVQAYRDSRKGNSEAARHLGRSIHYLQDLTDISKHWSHKDDDAKRVRKYSEELAKRYLAETIQQKSYPEWLTRALRPIRSQFSGPPGTPKQYLDGALGQREELAKFFKAEMAKAGNNRSRRRDEFIELSMLGAIIGQEQWVSMYLRYIGVAETPIR